MNKKAMETAHLVEIILMVVVIVVVAVGIILKIPELAKKAEPIVPCPSDSFPSETECSNSCTNGCQRVEGSSCWECG